MLELLIRFALGGLIVSSFAAIGEVFKPKSFSGIFGAAPSVALVSLALTAGKEGGGTVAVLARSMVIGAVALYAYASACVAATKQERWPVPLSAVAAWVAWFAVAFAALGVGKTLGALP